MMNSSPVLNTIGIIGIGAMGMGIAKNLLGRGYSLVVRDIRPQAHEEAAALGMRTCDSSAALGRQADVAVVVVVINGVMRRKTKI